jgi:hypothetical protein
MQFMVKSISEIQNNGYESVSKKALTDGSSIVEASFASEIFEISTLSELPFGVRDPLLKKVEIL